MIVNEQRADLAFKLGERSLSLRRQSTPLSIDLEGVDTFKEDAYLSATPRQAPKPFPIAIETPPIQSTDDIALLALELHAEIGLKSFFETCVRILLQHFHANQVAILLPYEAKDVINTPWGVKAAYLNPVLPIPEGSLVYDHLRPLDTIDFGEDVTRLTRSRILEIIQLDPPIPQIKDSERECMVYASLIHPTLSKSSTKYAIPLQVTPVGVLAFSSTRPYAEYFLRKLHSFVPFIATSLIQALKLDQAEHGHLQIGDSDNADPEASRYDDLTSPAISAAITSDASSPLAGRVAYSEDFWMQTSHDSNTPAVVPEVHSEYFPYRDTESASSEMSNRSAGRRKSAMSSNTRPIRPRMTARSQSPDHAEPPPARLISFIVDSVPIHIITAEALSGRITWVNERALLFRGQSRHEVKLAPWSCMHEDDRSKFLDAWSNTISGEQFDGFFQQVRLRRKDGVYRLFVIRAVPVRDSKGQLAHIFHTAVDINDQRLAEREVAKHIEREEISHRYQTVAEAFPIMVFSATRDLGITYSNALWEEYSGQPREETLGLGFLRHVHLEDRHLCLGSSLDRTLAVAPSELMVRLLGQDKQYRWHIVKCNVEDGVIYGSCTDIHARISLENKITEAHAAAQRSVEAKAMFLSNMSHEVRQPLIGITGMVNFLFETSLSTEQLDYANTIKQSADSLLLVINDILDLSKIEAGKMVLNNAEFSVSELLEDANNLLSTMAFEKGLDVNYLVETDVDDRVIGDRIRLRQVLLNLIGNALKFTNFGEVMVYCRSKEMNTDKMTLEFDVVDTGIGFDEEDARHMFKPFSQVDGSTTRKVGGTGLGLHISKNLIELHGGTLKCKSRKGKGSTFTFSVVVSRRISSAPVSPLVFADDYKVLVISNREHDRRAMEHHILKLISTTDNVVKSVSGIDHAIRSLKSSTYSHVFANLSNDDIDIFIKSMPHSLETTFVFLTFPNQRTTKEEVEVEVEVSSDRVKFMNKPLKLSKLLPVLDPSKSVEMRSETMSSTAVKLQRKGTDELAQKLENKNLRVLLAEDNPINQKVLVRMVTNTNLIPDTTVDGNLCLEKFFSKPYGYYVLLLVSASF